MGSDVIALIPENTARAVEAVARLQAEASASAPAGPAASAEARIQELEKRARQWCAGVHKTAKGTDAAQRQWLIAVVKNVQRLVKRLELEIR